jgi:hypothetical protein
MAAICAASAALAMAGCAGKVPEVKAPPVPAEPPVILEAAQIDRILGSLADDLEAAAAEMNAEPLENRVGGAALTMVTAQYAAKAANPDGEIFELGWKFADGCIVSLSREWPRSFVVVGESAEAEAPFIYQIQQADARSPYKLVAWARMLGGADVPPAAAPGVGSPQVGVNSDDGLRLSPAAALEAYAAAKQNPTAEQATLFDTAHAPDQPDRDPARGYWNALVQSLTAGVSALDDHKLTQNVTAVEGSVFAVATADGGALVFGQVKSTIDLSFRPQEGASVLLSPKGYTGLGATTLTVQQSAYLEYLQTVVLAVPPAGGEGPVRVIAVADVPVLVSVK